MAEFCYKSLLVTCCARSPRGWLAVGCRGRPSQPPCQAPRGSSTRGVSSGQPAGLPCPARDGASKDEIDMPGQIFPRRKFPTVWSL